jgi:hypothetical protein
MSRLVSGTLVVFLAAVNLPVLGAADVATAAQDVTGTIVGTIVDEQGQVVPGATVAIVNEATTNTRTVVSDARGAFQVTTLPPGTYTIRVTMASFSTAERTRVVLSAAERLSVGAIALAIGGIGETVVVEASGSRVNTEETQHSGLITARQIEQISVRAGMSRR